MKIAVFSDAFLPQFNGMVVHLLEALPILAKNHQVIIFAANQPDIKIPQEFIRSNIETVLLPSLPLPLYQSWRISSPFYPQVNSKLKKFNPNLIHFHSPFTISANGIIYAKKNKIPAVGSFHGYFMEPEYLKIVGLDKIGLADSKMINNILWRYSNMFYNQATRVICPSFATKRDLINHKIKSPVDVISNGIDLASYKMSRSSIKYNLPEDYLLYVGRISAEKNIDIMIDAFSKLNKLILQKLHLVIVGDGPYKKEAVKLSRQFNLDKKIIWLGYIDHRQLITSDVYKKAFCYISASTSETQGISFLEAMAYGLPIIGVDAKAVPELIDNNGILCQRDNAQSLSQAIIKLISDPKLVDQYRQQSLKLVQIHDINNTVVKLEKTYHKAMNQLKS